MKSYLKETNLARIGSDRHFYGDLTEDFHFFTLEGRRWRFGGRKNLLEVVCNRVLKCFTVKDISKIIGRKYYV